ncbi:MAG: globin [Ilumatobacter sp.]|uniref:globin n=1 Tax=Ilumatobacter sp. TaxID=1967498 RepID=UPI00263383C2|nr:globin [Ilumatobacter sp.]MDJ0769075.1 globin [Ilumatobacter sp.]
MSVTALSLFSRAGGMPFFERLVAAFYDGVAGDDVLGPLYPDFPDFEPAKHRLTLFLAQYWGGPHTYMEERGHPRLRMRHFPFHVGPLERDRWLTHMAAAVELTCAEVDDGEAIAGELMAYFVPAAEHLRNDTGLPITSAGYGKD